MFHTLGIDPGLDGGLVFLRDDGVILAAYRMPTRKVQKADGGTKRFVDEDRLAEIVRSHQEGLREAWIEDVHAIGKGKGGKGRDGRSDGVVGAFSFGEGKGILKGVLGALGVPRRYTPPATWKAAMGVSADKAQTMGKAQRLFAKQASLLVKDGPAEAALIALYGFMRGAHR